MSASRDIARQITVIAAFCFMIVGCFVGVGVFGGTPIQDAQGGSFRPDASYLTPAIGAFGIWTPIYSGLLCYTVWQALPGQRSRPRQRALGWWIAATMTANGLWLVTVQFLPIGATLAAVVLLLVLLSLAFARAVRTREASDGAIDAVLIDGTTGLHLGWTTLATVANVGALLTRIAPSSWAAGASVVGVIVIVAVAVIGGTIGWRSRGRITPAVAIAWGLCWLAVARAGGAAANTPIAVAAIVAAVIVLLAAVLARIRRIRAS